MNGGAPGRSGDTPFAPAGGVRGEAVAGRVPSARICLTGSELTRGETRDRNGPYLCRELAALGVRVEEVAILPDDPAILVRAFREAAAAADIVVTSGGLGPTADDCTVRALAAACGRRVVEDAVARERMLALARSRLGPDSPIPASFTKQAEVVEGARVLQNSRGLAPGSLVETPRGLVAALPGVPHELQAMFQEHLLPAIRARFALVPPRIVRALVAGQPESIVEARIRDLGLDWSQLEYGISARPGEILVKLIARSPPAAAALESARRRLEEAFGDELIVLTEGLSDASGAGLDASHARAVHEVLLRAGSTVAVAESCTGGLVARRLTDHPGSSAYFLGAVVAYHNRIKESLLAVDPELLAEHGAVSAPVCEAMARACRRLFAADYALATTGIAGPGGGSDTKPIGLAYTGLAGPGGAEVERHLFAGDRDAVRARAAVAVLEMLRRRLAARG